MPWVLSHENSPKRLDPFLSRVHEKQPLRAAFLLCAAASVADAFVLLFLVGRVLHLSPGISDLPAELIMTQWHLGSPVVPQIQALGPCNCRAHRNEGVGMVLTLHIRHEGPHKYLARVFDGKELVGDFTCHERIDDAIASYAVEAPHRFPGVAAFSIWYGGWTVGEVSISHMRTDAPQLANRLVVLSAVLR